MIKGSALRSRGMEKYLRDFLSEMFRLLLEGRAGEIAGLLGKSTEKLERHQFPISWLAKTESLSESPEVYREKVKEGKRNVFPPSMSWPLVQDDQLGRRSNCSGHRWFLPNCPVA